MNLKTFMATTAIVSGLVGAMPAQAQDSLYLPLFSYRTGGFAGSGTPIADGMHDYLEMINQRDGGIGGVKILIEECETGYDTKKGVECYESVKTKKPLIINPYSTGITLQLIPKAAADKVNILSMAYGLSASADGAVFPWVFNPPVTYWDGASAMVKYMANKEGGFEKLKGKKLGFVHLDAPFGKEPIPVLEALAAKYGFEIKLYPVVPAESANQSALWLNVRRDKPDYIYNQGFGIMNPTAVKEAVKVGYPMDKFVGVWWAGGDDDARAGGEGAKGYSTLSFHGAGKIYPFMTDMIKHVHDKGLSKWPKDRVGENLYNHGAYNSMLMVEAIKNAQKITGKKLVNSEDVRRGLETLSLDDAQLKAIGMEGFASPVKVTCANHNGHNKMFVMTWDGAKYVQSSDWIEPIKDIVLPLIEADAKKYAETNAGWPKRTEGCDAK